MHVFWSLLEHWTLIHQDEKGIWCSCVFAWCCITREWYSSSLFNHGLLLKCQTHCSFIFPSVIILYLLEFILTLESHRNLSHPVTPAKFHCTCFYSWYESFWLCVILFESEWDCVLRKWDNEKGSKKKSNCNPVSRQYWCITLIATALLPFSLFWFTLYLSPTIFDIQRSRWQVTIAFFYFYCSSIFYLHITRDINRTAVVWLTLKRLYLTHPANPTTRSDVNDTGTLASNTFI